jgi:glycosyltransferase involved in cell wall biosynthesis
VKPLVTALVDTFNHEPYIEQALVSVLEQELSSKELEIVVVDDGSTDKTESIIRKFEPRVKYLRKNNGGQASAFNTAFPEISGQIVSILDGDDWWAHGKLRTVVDHLQQNPEISALSHAYYQYYEVTNELRVCGPPETIVLNLATPDAARAAFLGWAYLAPCALTVQRKVLEKVMPIPEALVFSADSPIAVASMAMGVRVLPQPLSYYRIHRNNLYALTSDDPVKLQRKYEMDDLMYGVLWSLLRRLEVPTECISAFIDPAWTWINRHCLHTFGGSRRKTFRTEMRDFRATHRNPSLGRRIFKYLMLGPATLVLSPQRFYELRDWYSKHNFSRFWGLGEADAAGRDRRTDHPGK